MDQRLSPSPVNPGYQAISEPADHQEHRLGDMVESLSILYRTNALFGDGRTLTVYALLWAMVQVSGTLAVIFGLANPLLTVTFLWWPVIDGGRVVLAVLIRAVWLFWSDFPGLKPLLFINNCLGFVMGTVGYVTYMIIVSLEADLISDIAPLLVLASICVSAHFVFTVPAILAIFAPKRTSESNNFLAIQVPAAMASRQRTASYVPPAHGHVLGRRDVGTSPATEDEQLARAIEISQQEEESRRRSAVRAEQDAAYERALHEDSVRMSRTVGGEEEKEEEGGDLKCQEPDSSDDENPRSASPDDSGAVQLRVRLPNGTVHTETLLETQTLSALYKSVRKRMKSQADLKGKKFRLVTTLPREIYDECAESLKSRGISAKLKHFSLLVELV
eukprot:575960_1